MTTCGAHEQQDSEPWGPTAIQPEDATSITLRPISASDSDGLLRFHATLSSRTIYNRYFSNHPLLSARELERFTHVDHRDREAVVAVAGGEIIAVGRFDRLTDPVEAEVAFVVCDEWQGRGLGTAMFGWLAARAGDLGVTRFVAETMSSNRPMLTVFRHCGRPVTVTYDDDVAHVGIDLTAGGCSVIEPSKARRRTTCALVGTAPM
jgi:GNAT superfamily N-acetyltransferase